jgi:hypothetical protein
MAPTEIDIRLLPGFSIIEELEAGKTIEKGKGGVEIFGSGSFWLVSEGPQSRQNAKLFLGRPNWDSSTPSHAGDCVPPPFVPGGGHTRLRKRGLGSPNSNEGTGSGTLGINMYFVVESIGCEARYHIERFSRWSESHGRDLPSHRERTGGLGGGGEGSVLPLYTSVGNT